MANDTYIKLRKRSFRYRYYVYFDIPTYMADQLFVAHRIEVRYDCEYSKDGDAYCAVFCHVRKRDAAEFEEMLNILPERMVACGYGDYPEKVGKIIDMLTSGMKRREKKRRG